MYFKHIHTLSPRFPRPTSLPYTSYLVSIFFSKHAKSIWYWLYALGCVDIQWRLASLPGDMPLKKRNSFSLSRYQPLISLQLGVGCPARLPPGCDFVWLELAQSWCLLPQLLWGHMCSSPAVSRKHYFPVVIHCLCILNLSSLLFFNVLQCVIWGLSKLIYVHLWHRYVPFFKCLEGDKHSEY